MMTLEEFKEIWKQHMPEGIETKMDASPETIEALVAAANGDMSKFDAIKARLEAFDNSQKQV